MKGFILIDKAKGWTSFDVVKKIRGLSGEKKVGHAGTLDPIATGLLLVAVGEGTKLLEYFIGCDKEYEVLGHFGFVSDTFDAEGVIEECNSVDAFERVKIEDLIKNKFTGLIKQVPPKYSALKIKGKKAYELARAGEEPEMKEREVEIKDFKLIETQWPFVKFKVLCGSGTYIRSLIHDLGMELGLGAYVQDLRRTRLGAFSVSDAVKVGDLDKFFIQNLRNLEEMVDSFERIELSITDRDLLSNGRVLMGKKIDREVAMAFCEGVLLGVVENVSEGNGIKYKKVIH